MILPDYMARDLQRFDHPLQQLLRRVKYRPGWEFSINEDGAVVVTAEVVDSYDHSHTIPLVLRKFLPMHVRHDFEWERWLFEFVIMEVERHEAREFFEVDGVKIFDPHHDGVISG